MEVNNEEKPCSMDANRMCLANSFNIPIPSFWNKRKLVSVYFHPSYVWLSSPHDEMA